MTAEHLSFASLDVLFINSMDWELWCSDCEGHCCKENLWMILVDAIIVKILKEGAWLPLLQRNCKHESGWCNCCEETVMDLGLWCRVRQKVWRNINSDAVTYGCLCIKLFSHSGLLLVVGSVIGWRGQKGRTRRMFSLWTLTFIITSIMDTLAEFYLARVLFSESLSFW